MIFWLLAGFFRNNIDRFFSTGVYRVTSSDIKVRELELHLSQGNYGYLEQEKNLDPHIVANYLKRVLRQMKTPLIPQKQYKAMGKLRSIPETGNERNHKIREIIESMPPIN